MTADKKADKDVCISASNVLSNNLGLVGLVGHVESDGKSLQEIPRQVEGYW